MNKKMNSDVANELAVNGVEDVALFEASIVNDIDFSASSCTYNPPISPSSPGDNLLLRPLRLGDYDKGFMQLLKQITVVGDVSREQFEARFNNMLACKNGYYIVIIEDTTSSLVIGSATLAVEQKFIHTCSNKGRIEDVVVDRNYRGRQLGKMLVDFLALLSRHVGCYKVSLECKDEFVKFYSNFGFVKEEGQNYMCRRF